MYAAILTDPFAMRYKPAVAAAIDTLQTTMAACWPRFANTPWQEETLKMLMLCWLHIEEDAEQTQPKGREDAAADLQTGLVRVADTLFAIGKAAGVDCAAMVDPLVAREPRLQALFQRSP